ncbi:YceI family protein [Nonomuraea sp. NPDC005650]|uniref:YceI family protein n=1 Tax=Nonomuraea sp. NPDC005650 TaxID=3157045 RepID=UPI0033BAF831
MVEQDLADVGQLPQLFRREQVDQVLADASFDSSSVKHAGGDSFEVTGDLTIRGVTRQIAIPLDYTGTAIDAQGLTRVGFEGSTVINRKDFGITYNAVLETGGVMISDKIALEFDLSAVKTA